MLVLTEALLTLVSVALLVPVVVLAAEVFLARDLARSYDGQQKPRPRVAVLIPAHNEAAGIAATIRSVVAQTGPSDRVLVVADNCTDQTAAVALTAGAHVIERADPERRGKGFALDHGVSHLATDPPDFVIVVDADCEVRPGSLDQLVWASLSSGRPTQALDLMVEEGGARSVRSFAWILKNQVRPLGLRRAGLPCQLMGTGMAFPWEMIRRAKLASGALVEDVKLGLELAVAGTPPLFCPSALVVSKFPQSQEGAAAQVTRWEHGHLALILREVPRLIVQSVLKRSPSLAVMALDVSVPPLSLLVLLLLAVLLAAIAYSWATGRIASSVMVSGLGLAMTVLALARAWGRFGRQAMSPRDVGLLVLYGARKVPVYVRFLVARQGQWIRTKRHDR